MSAGISVPLSLRERVDDDVAEAAKGVLILMVILGHAANLFSPEPFPFLALKFFHVAVFLILPFAYDIRPFSLMWARDRCVRYYWPYALFLIAYGIMNLVVLRGFSDVSGWLRDVLVALLVGSGRMIDAATGLSALWFLPAYTGISFLIALLIGRWRWPFWALLAAAVFGNATAGLLPEPLRHYLPLGMANVMFLFLPGLFLRLVLNRMDGKSRLRAAPFFGLALLALLGASWWMGTYIKFPVIALPSLFDPLALVLHGAIILCAALFLLTAPWFAKSAWLRFFGRHSLQIYLLHLPFVLLPTVLAERSLDPSPQNPLAWLALGAIFVCGLCAAALMAWALEKTPRVRGALFPADWRGLKAALRCDK